MTSGKISQFEFYSPFMYNRPEENFFHITCMWSQLWFIFFASAKCLVQMQLQSVCCIALPQQIMQNVGNLPNICFLVVPWHLIIMKLCTFIWPKLFRSHKISIQLFVTTLYCTISTAVHLR